jgi:hypothetical protein
MVIGTASIVNFNLHTIVVVSNSYEEQQQVNMTFDNIICE